MTTLDHVPQFTPADAGRLARELYDLAATAVPLPSERDQNFKLTTPDGKQFVLKIANGRESAATLAAQQQAMTLLATRTKRVPRIIPTVDGKLLAKVNGEDGRAHHVWLITYLPGQPLGKMRHHSPKLLTDLGHTLGQIDRVLANFDHPAIHRDFHWDLQRGLAVIEQHLPLVADREMQALISSFAADFARDTAPLLPGLRRSAIHNDANDYNVIVHSHLHQQRVLGLVDFGDMVHSLTVADPAIAVAYAVLDKPDPLAAAVSLVRGYHEANALREDELAALFPLACLRLAASVCIAAAQQQQRPDDPYLGISQAPIRRTLPRLLAIHPRLAQAAFRAAAGLPPVTRSPALAAWLRANQANFAPILPLELRTAPVLDLSVSSPLLHGDPDENTEPKLTARIWQAMAGAGAAAAAGRYDEPRLIYTAPFFATDSGERRTIHVGLDLFAAARTAVHAPLPATVHALADNDAAQDYGPVVVLRHETAVGPFFTLYGHLSRDSLARLTVGQTIDKGEPFAAIGAAHENGRWPPHLHFQIITDLLDLGADFPGVAPASQRAVWRSLCPDPNLIAGIPAERFPPAPPPKSETLAARRQRLGGNLSIAYGDPVKIVRGWMQYLYDENGRQYLDAYNNVPHVGHAHPRIVAAAQQQMAILNTNTRYLHDLPNRYAERLAATLPDPLSICYFVNSASEANELALRLARAYTGQREMIVLEAAYHGHTTGLIDISPYKHAGPGGRGAPDWVHTAPIPDTYRGPYKADDPHAGAKYAQHVAAIIEKLQAKGKGLAGFIAESLPSVGGQIVPPPGYLEAIYRAVRAAGGVCIADDVQTGYGRTGAHFYGFEAQGVTPDIVVLGKPIGNGHPIGAVITTPEIAAAFDNGMEFFSTFGGNTVSCAVGLAVLDVVQQEKLQAHALAVGERMLAGLRPLRDRFAIVGDVRGSGLFLGVELVRDRETLEPAGAEASFVADRMRDRGILLGTDGPFHNVVKIRPPMPFSAADAGRLVATLAEILAEVSEMKNG